MLFGIVRSKVNQSNEVVERKLTPLESAVEEYNNAENNYNNSLTTDQQDVFFYAMQAAKAKISMITNDSKLQKLQQEAV